MVVFLFYPANVEIKMTTVSLLAKNTESKMGVFSFLAADAKTKTTLVLF
jgi:hypothetical protein